MYKKEKPIKEEIKTPKKKGRIPQVVERKIPLTKEEEETLKKSEFGRLLRRV